MPPSNPDGYKIPRIDRKFNSVAGSFHREKVDKKGSVPFSGTLQN